MLKCPHCKKSNDFCVEARTSATLDGSGNIVSVGDADFDGRDMCTCNDCGYSDELRMFEHED